MADQLYLSLWYPNFRLTALPGALERVMELFGTVAGSSRVKAAAVYPISWNEAPVYQRVYDDEHEPDLEASQPRQAIPAAIEMLHDDYAYEFELVWELWAPQRRLRRRRWWSASIIPRSFKSRRPALRT